MFNAEFSVCRADVRHVKIITYLPFPRVEAIVKMEFATVIVAQASSIWDVIYKELDDPEFYMLLRRD